METPSYPELESNAIHCPQCGSTKLHFMYYTPPGVARVACEDCGRTRYGEPTYKQGLRNFDVRRMSSAITKWNAGAPSTGMIHAQIEEYRVLRREIFALPDESYQDRKLELVPKLEALENLIHSQLLPCPMCGGSNIQISDTGAAPYAMNASNAVACNDCGLTLPVHSGAELSIERVFASMNKWNKRHG